MSVGEVRDQPDIGQQRVEFAVGEMPRPNRDGGHSGGVHRRRPKSGWYAIAFVFPVLAVALAIMYWALSLQTFADNVSGFNRFTPPGEVTQTFDVGRVHIYAEPAQVESDTATNQLEQVEVFSPDGSPVALVPYLTLPRTEGGWTYEVAGHQGVGVTSFAVDEPGEYRIVASGGDGMTLAIGDGVGQAREKITFNAVGYAFLGFLAGGVVAGAIAMLRRRPIA